MGRPLVSVTLSLLMLTSLLCIIPPMAVADESTEIVEPICNANRNDTWTVGLIYCDDRADEDYTLFAPMSSASTYLIDTHGRMIHSWTSSSSLRPGLSAYMLDDGDLLRTANIGTDGGGAFSGGGIAGKIERISWDGQMEWEWYYVGDSRRSHHDIEPLPNGNFLMIAWEKKTTEEAEQAGRDPDKMSQNQLWPDHIVEVQPVGTNEANIVWKWHMWDHLIQDFDSTKDNYGVVADHPELLDVNFADAAGPNKYKSDWMHCNGIDYNPILDQIALSCKNTNEIYIIDHSTTTEEAAGHTGGNSGKGGDILYRWGNPEAYRAGGPEDQQLFGQHDIQWIQEGRPGAGDLSLFNNGNGRSVGYSSVDVISPPLVNGEYFIEPGSAWGPVAPNWTWDQGTDMYGTSISGAERLANGNTLVTWGQKGTFYEVSLDGEIVWEYINPVVGDGPMNQGETIPQGQNANSQQNTVFKSHRYNSSFPGF
ncbi:MAG: aryl-sulfate sulfotransferase, partial [Candidatus Thalassarchaeum sp.]|nr:aryl-sulfate sulfotransferase [Candidatus Thalassarchaeum sp.]